MRDIRRRLSACVLIVVSSVVVTETQQQQRDRGRERSRADLAAAAGGSVTSVDSDGVPKFVWAAGARPGPTDATHDGAARWHLRQFARAYDVTSADVSSADTVSVQALKTGDVIVQLRQRYRGVEVMGSDVKVMMHPDHQLVAISGRPRATGGAEMRWEQSREAALAAALSAQFGSPVSVSSIGTETMVSGEERFRLAPGSRLYMSEAAPVRPVMFPVGGRLVAAYVMEFYAGAVDSADAAAFRYVVAAADGRVLERRDLTVSEKKKDPPSAPPPVDFLYRVYAEPSNQRPLDGPQQDLSPHPTGFPDGTTSPFLPSNLVTMGGFNDPPSGVPDPWLSPDATETNGNNADAYVDFSAPDGLTPGVDFRADVTSARSFDRTYDLTLGPTATVDQSKASITNAFYTVNWLHDYWYDSGFDEAAGNAQLNNFGRGGVEGDPMRVELQDNFLGGSRNNANMSTPSDGLRPRMQMYTWFGEQAATLTLAPGGDVPVGTASFGPTNFDINAQVALANDGAGVTSDACQPLVGFVPGRIALADRGTCNFTIKAINAQVAGAVGILIANNVAGTTPPGLGGADPLVTIGAFGITQAAGNSLKASIPTGVSARMFRLSGTERDGALDNTIVAHEWGHYIHHRLADCGQSQCGAMSEGWGDFIAMHTIARDGDNLDGTYALATYATSAFDPNSAYFGIRRVPYSVDVTKNAFTFKHITDGVALPPVPTLPGGPNSEVHNAGEIWTTMLWEGYVALQKARGGDSFDDVRRRMADYVVGGLKMAPRDATFTEQRDAILAAAASSRRDDDHGHGGGRHGDRSGSGDMLTLANAFARRGAGTCAVSPPRDSVNFAGVVESFDIRPRIGVGEIRLDEDKSCDRDGFVDAGERGTIVVPVMNSGPIEMRDTTVSITTSTPGVSFRHGSSVRIARLDPFSTREAEIEIEVDRTFTGIGMLTVNVNVSNGESCEPLVSRAFTAWINVDEALNASNVDTVETPTTPWTAAGDNADEIWSRVEVMPFNRAWFGLDFGAPSDTTLESPALFVGTTAPFVIEFDHRFGFEADLSTSPPIFFDGGMIEISRNGGPWEDISNFVAPGYGGTLFIGSDNPLGGRQAFVGRNAAFPARNHLTLNLGTGFAGQTVRMRFRIGTDAAAADIGWEIDNIAFQGITNKPFAEFIADLAKCRGVPKKDK